MKTRIIPIILVRDFGVVKTVAFDFYRPLGVATNFARVYNAREVDELIVLDISPDRAKSPPDLECIRDIADECFMPLCVGGGLKTIADVKAVIQSGADKVAINSHALVRPEFIREVSEEFGSQCAVVSIDAKKVGGSYRVFGAHGRKEYPFSPAEWAKQAESFGAGEILINSIDRDGAMKGYDLELISSVSSAVRIPVIAAGGAGVAEDCAQAVLIGGAQAVACSSIFHYTEATPAAIKAHMGACGIEVRRM